VGNESLAKQLKILVFGMFNSSMKIWSLQKSFSKLVGTLINLAFLKNANKNCGCNCDVPHTDLEDDTG
jgi:hypothetical protein